MGAISWNLPSRRFVYVLAPCLLICACQTDNSPVNEIDRAEFATRYAAAWSGQDPDALAEFYSENGSLRINDGQPAVGRDAVRETARSFMAAFPDMVVRLVELRGTDDHLEFHWHWTGTNTGPGGTGNAVDLVGYEQWTLDEDGLILESLGYFDDAEYQRQLSAVSVVPEIIEIFACSDLCPEPEETYLRRVYKDVTDQDECRRLGGTPFSVTGWGTHHYCAVVEEELNVEPGPD